MPQGTLRLHRVPRAKTERVCRAFLDADAMAEWLPPHGFTGKVALAPLALLIEPETRTEP
jgi:uncharacterized protein YndB with AHSA1/START domain